MLRKWQAAFCLAALASILMASVALAAVGWLAFVAAPQPADGTIEVTWSTGSEPDTVAFALYRSEQANGPWGDPVDLQPSQGDAGSGYTYTYVDYDVMPGVMYYYQVEALSSTGGAEVCPTVVHARVSPPPRAFLPIIQRSR